MKDPRPSAAALRGLEMGLVMADDALGAGWEAKASVQRDLRSAKKWLLKAFEAANARSRGACK